MDWLRRVARAVRDSLRRRRPRPAPLDGPGSVAEVVERLRTLESELGPADGVHAFTSMYLRVTELVRDRIAEGYFRDAGFLSRLDVIFAGLFLEQVTAPEGRVSPAWAPLFEARSLSCAPVLFAIAGMNAHINHDLPIAVVRTCKELGLRPGAREVRADYDAVTALLAEVHEEVRRSFLDGAARAADQALAPVVNQVGAWSIGKAREAAWVTAGILWEIDGVHPLDRDYLDMLSRSVGLAGRLLLAPAAPGPTKAVAGGAAVRAE